MTVTLEEYILKKQGLAAKGRLTLILNRIASASKVVASMVRGASLASDLGYTGKKNASGDQTHSLDESANDVFTNILSECDYCAALASEEIDHTTVISSSAPYMVCYDPLDGSSNIGMNVSIGSIFGVYRVYDKPDFIGTTARDIVIAGYVVYGPATTLTLAIEGCVSIFTLDPAVGEYFLTHENITIPKDGKIYSINESNSERWDDVPHVKEWVDLCKKKGRSVRWVGSMVADCHRTLLKGGLFTYPEDTKNVSGKLRLLYEAAPMAFVFHHAGGRAVTVDGRDLMDLELTELHQKTPVVLGSPDMVEELLDLR